MGQPMQPMMSQSNVNMMSRQMSGMPAGQMMQTNQSQQQQQQGMMQAYHQQGMMQGESSWLQLSSMLIDFVLR
jgi:hypothetical protein